MNRLPLFFLAVAAFPPPPAPASAQQSIALWAGVNATWREDASFPNSEQELRPLNRLAAGATGTFPTRSRFSVQLGVGYARKGSVVRRTSSRGDLLKATREADYLDMTILGRVEFAPAGNRINLHLLAGPFLAFPVWSCTRFSSVERTSETCEAPQPLPPIDAGMAIGGGTDLPLTERFAVTIGVLYSHRFIYSDGHEFWHGRTGEFLRNLALRVGLAHNFH